jgi:hypothetical protein
MKRERMAIKGHNGNERVENGNERGENGVQETTCYIYLLN